MPTSRRRVVTHRKRRPPVAHCRSTVAASRRITGRVSHRVSDPHPHGKTAAGLKVAAVTAENTSGRVLRPEGAISYERRSGSGGVLLPGRGHVAVAHPALLAE